MNSIADETLDPTNQLLLTEKSSAADLLDTPSESEEPQTDRALHVSTILKSIPGYHQGGLND